MHVCNYLTAELQVGGSTPQPDAFCYTWQQPQALHADNQRLAPGRMAGHKVGISAEDRAVYTSSCHPLARVCRRAVSSDTHPCSAETHLNFFLKVARFEPERSARFWSINSSAPG